MEYETNPIASFDIKRSGNMSNALIGILFFTLGLAAKFVPQVYRFLASALGGGGFLASVGWILLCLVGIGIVFSAMRGSKYRNVTLYRDSLVLKSAKGEERYGFERVKKINDFVWKKTRSLKIDITEPQKNAELFASDIPDFDTLSRELQKAHCEFLLGADYMDRLEALSCSFGKNLKLERGSLYYKDVAVAFDSITQYSAAKWGSIPAVGVDVSINTTALKQGTIVLLSNEIENRWALVEILGRTIPHK